MTFINEQGLFKGASAEPRTVIGDRLQHSTSRELAKRLIDFVAEPEKLLGEGIAEFLQRHPIRNADE